MTHDHTAREIPPGRLFICPTPIGNLSDASPRLIETLGNVGYIACEDTRVTGKLRHLLGISTSATLFTYNDHHEAAQASRLVECMLEGVDVALVSDAGTPAVSDPGYRLVQLAWESSINIISLPGPCAAVVGLAASGLPSDRFLFVGFPPTKNNRRLEWLKDALNGGGTVIGYESPRRIVPLLQDIDTIVPNAIVYIGRELSKLNEEHLRATASELVKILSDRDSIKGEIVFAIDARHDGTDDAATQTLKLKTIVKDLYAARVHPKEIKSLVSKWFSVSKSDVFALLEEIKEGN